MAAERDTERIIISTGVGEPPDTGKTKCAGRRRPEKRRSRRRLTALGWLMLFWCGLLVLFSRKLIFWISTSPTFNLSSVIIPKEFWIFRFLLIVTGTPSEMLLWALLDQDYGWIGCSIIGLAFSTLLFVCMAHVFEMLGFLVHKEELG